MVAKTEAAAINAHPFTNTLDAHALMYLMGHSSHQTNQTNQTDQDGSAQVSRTWKHQDWCAAGRQVFVSIARWTTCTFCPKLSTRWHIAVVHSCGERYTRVTSVFLQTFSAWSGTVLLPQGFAGVILIGRKACGVVAVGVKFASTRGNLHVYP